jgi:hypothetical protein
MKINNIFNDINSLDYDRVNSSFSRTYESINNFIESSPTSFFGEDRLSDKDIDSIIEETYNIIKNYDNKIPFNEGDIIKIPEDILSDIIFKSLHIEGYYTVEELSSNPEEFRNMAEYKADSIIKNNATITFKGKAYFGRFGDKKPLTYENEQVFILGVKNKTKAGIEHLSSLYITEDDLEKTEVTTKFEIKDLSEYTQILKDAYANWISRVKDEDLLSDPNTSIDSWMKYLSNCFLDSKKFIIEGIEQNKSKKYISEMFEKMNKEAGKYLATKYFKLTGIPKPPVQTDSYIDKYADLWMKGKAPDHFNKFMAKIEK